MEKQFSIAAKKGMDEPKIGEECRGPRVEIFI